MAIRVAAIEVSHWHALYDAAYLRHLVAMPDVELVAVQDSDAGLVAKRAAEVGNPATFTNYRQMLTAVRPDFVVALGRHRQMARIAHDLLDQGYPFLMEKPMGIDVGEVEAVAAKAARLKAFVAVPLAQRYAPFATWARKLLAAGRFGPVSHIYIRINRPGPSKPPFKVNPPAPETSQLTLNVTALLTRVPRLVPEPLILIFSRAPFPLGVPSRPKSTQVSLPSINAAAVPLKVMVRS